MRITLEQVDAGLAEDRSVDDRALLWLYRAKLTGEPSVSKEDLARLLKIDSGEVADVLARLSELGYAEVERTNR